MLLNTDRELLYNFEHSEFVWRFEPIVSSPILITVPHDGNLRSDFTGFFEERKNGFKGNDKYVWPIVKDIVRVVRVNVVRGMFSRLFIDYNRPLEKMACYENEVAVEDGRLKPFFINYHSQIEKILKNIIAEYGEKTLLVDFHGFGKQPPYGEFDLILGTGNRQTIKHESVDNEFSEFMLKKEYKVFLPGEKPVIERGGDWYDAGFTTRHYAEKFCINVIQIECDKKFRVLEGEKIGKKLSADIAEFLIEHFGL